VFFVFAGSLLFGPSPLFGNHFPTGGPIFVGHGGYKLVVCMIGISLLGLGCGTFLPLSSSLLLEAAARKGYDKDRVSETISSLLSIANQGGFIIGPVLGNALFFSVNLTAMETIFGFLTLLIPLYTLPWFLCVSDRPDSPKPPAEPSPVQVDDSFFASRRGLSISWPEIPRFKYSDAADYSPGGMAAVRAGQGASSSDHAC